MGKQWKQCQTLFFWAPKSLQVVTGVQTCALPICKESACNAGNEESEKVCLKLNIQKTKVMASSPITSWQIDGETVKTVADYFLGSRITADRDCSYEIKRCLVLGRKLMTNLGSILKRRDITLPTKVHLVKVKVFFSSHIWLCEFDHKESWVLKNWCFWTVVLENTFESPLDCKEIKPVNPPGTGNPKGNQSWIFIGRTDAEAEAPILWPSDVKNWLIGKVPGAGKDWRREEKGTTEDGIVGWHHWLDGHEFEQARCWWWTGNPGALQSMGSQRVIHDWMTELTELKVTWILKPSYEIVPWECL